VGQAQAELGVAVRLRQLVVGVWTPAKAGQGLLVVVASQIQEPAVAATFRPVVVVVVVRQP
jgi:hypothetical protein